MRHLPRPLLPAFAAFLAAVATSACAAAPPDATGGGAAVPHAYGETVVGDRPERVVSIGLHEHDTLLALGVVPVGVHQWYAEYGKGVGPWAEPLLKGAEPEVIPAEQTEVDVEQVAEMAPDLIVGTYAAVTKTDYERLSKVAPTLVRPKGYDDFAVPYDVETEMIGKAVGKEKEAKELVEDTEAEFAKARKAHPEFRGKDAAAGCLLKNDGIGLYTGTDPRGAFLTKLGFTVPEEIDKAADGAYYAELGAEELDTVDDYDLLLLIDDCGPPTATLAEHGLFPELDIAKEKRYIYPAPASDAVSHNTVLSIPHALEELVPPIAGTIAR